MFLDDNTEGRVRSLIAKLERKCLGSAEAASVDEIERYLAAATKLIEESRCELQRTRELFVDDGAPFA